LKWCVISGLPEGLHLLVLRVSTHLSHHGWLKTGADSTFEVILEMYRAEDVTVVSKILSASFYCTSWTSKRDAICHQRLYDAYIWVTVNTLLHVR
jgi:hypothetical protein